MSRRFLGALFLSLGLAGLLTAADGPDFTALARRAWAVTDAVQANHLAPPPRIDLLVAGVEALLHKTNEKVPDDLRDRLAKVTDAGQLAGVLKDVWPAAGSADKLTDYLVQGLLPRTLGKGDRVIDENDPVLNPADAKIQEQLLQNRYVGTGIQIRKNEDDDYVEIVLAFAGGPARRAARRAHDLIVEVDGKSMKDKSVQDLVTALRGDEGTDVQMTVRQPDAAEKRILRMTRTVVPFETALGYRRTGETTWQYRPDPKLPIAYVRIANINVSTLHDVRRIEPKLIADGAKALVLDLRQSAGDLGHTAMVADGLLDGGVIWRTRGAKGEVKEQKADADCQFRGWPIAVLVDGRNLSPAAALLAAALQDNHRAIVVGEPTPPVGPVRGLIRLPDHQGAILLTTAFLDRAATQPGAAKNQPWSVEPDHRVALEDAAAEAVAAWHRAQDSPDAPATNGAPPEDAALTKALEVLKAALPAGR